MTEVVVTRKGQATIPKELRVKLGIREGSRLVAIDKKKGILFKKTVTLADLAGSAASNSTPEKMKRLLDRLRSEDL